MSNRPRAPSAGWSLFPPPETTRVPDPSQLSRNTSTHRGQKDPLMRRSSHAGGGAPATCTPSHDARTGTQFVSPAAAPPTSWKSSTPHARSVSNSRGYTRPVSAEPPTSSGALRHRGQSLTPRSESAQSYYTDAATRHHPTRSASRNGHRPASRTSGREPALNMQPQPQLRRKPLPGQPLRPRPSSPTLNQRCFNPGTPRPAPTPPKNTSPISQNGSVRTSMSVDAAGNPRSFWDLDSERGDAGSDDEKLDLVRKVRSWSLAKRGSVAFDEKAGPHYRQEALRAERSPTHRPRASKRRSSSGWRERVLCSC